MLTQQTISQLRLLKLNAMADAYHLQLAQPATQSLSFDERLGLLVDQEMTERENRKLKRILRSAQLREHALLENIDFAPARGLDKTQIATLAGYEWARRQQNILITGATGTGKSWLASAFGMQGCRLGMSVLYRSATHLFQEIEVATGDGSLQKLKQSLIKPTVLIIDDFGLSPMSLAIGYILLDVIDARLQTGSLIITSQFPPGLWHERFPDPTLADAILDRIVHRSYRIVLKGPSLRKLHGGID
ncbi:MAG: hypothetical protein QG667_1272 [Pseudomonadota bacterium]|jgi:DNA replication protein DnaC|nr:hypothetical protein [Pseudomonadota bacterium]